MLEIETTKAVKKVVDTFQVVRQRHLQAFFKDRDPSLYRAAMTQLLVADKMLHVHGEDIVSFCYPGKLPSPLHTYTSTLKCLDMLTGTMTASEVVWFDTADFPLSMRFMTVNGEMYDVTYMDETTWVNKYGLLQFAWKKCVPPGQEDPFNHIAVVPNLDVAQNLRDLPFTQFVVVNHHGTILGIYDNE